MFKKGAGEREEEEGRGKDSNSLSWAHKKGGEREIREQEKRGSEGVGSGNLQTYASSLFRRSVPIIHQLLQVLFVHACRFLVFSRLLASLFLGLCVILLRSLFFLFRGPIQSYSGLVLTVKPLPRFANIRIKIRKIMGEGGAGITNKEICRKKSKNLIKMG